MPPKRRDERKDDDKKLSGETGRFLFRDGCVYEGLFVRGPGRSFDISAPFPNPSSASPAAAVVASSGASVANGAAVAGAPAAGGGSGGAASSDPVHGAHGDVAAAGREVEGRGDKDSDRAPRGGDVGCLQAPPFVPCGVDIQRSGHGVLKDGNTVYSGEWRNDAMYGQGMLRFASGAAYCGSFSGNAFDGFGVYVWPDGTRYEGFWRGNLMHGTGVFIDRDGKRWAGKFHNGTSIGITAESDV